MRRLLAVLFALALVCTVGMAATSEVVPSPEVALELAALAPDANCTGSLYCNDCDMLNWGFDEDGYVWGIWQCEEDGEYCATCFASTNPEYPETVRCFE